MMTPNLALHVLRNGFGLPIVLLHAFPLDHRMWIDFTAALPGTPTVQAIDLPGFGDSPQPIADPSIDAAADGVAAALGPHARAVVVGISMGGYVALALAERHPEVVAALGLIDTKSTSDIEQAQANRRRIADEVEAVQSVGPVLGMAGVLIGATSRSQRPELTARIEGWIRGQRPGAIAWSQRAMAGRSDRTAVLESFAGPVLVAVGEEDTLAPIEDAQHMVRAARHAELVTVPAAGHLSAVESPADLASAVALLARRVRS